MRYDKKEDERDMNDRQKLKTWYEEKPSERPTRHANNLSLSQRGRLFGAWGCNDVALALT